MTELLSTISKQLLNDNRPQQATQIADAAAKYRSGLLSYQQAMGVLSDAVGRDQLVAEVTRLSSGVAHNPAAPV